MSGNEKNCFYDSNEIKIADITNAIFKDMSLYVNFNLSIPHNQI